ncbi:MAG: response regulator [Chryseolinea sp.]
MSTTLYRSIFLIDDDAEDQEIFIEALKEVYPDIQCLCSDDGEEALQQFTTNNITKPDLFFIDLNMPKLNGKEVLKRLKSINSLKNIPVIMFSTFFGDTDIKEFNESGAVHYMIKSTRYSDLCNALKETLSKKW